MTKEQLDAIRARVEAVNPQYWSHDGACFGDCCATEAERQVALHALTDIAALLAEVERLTAERDAAKPNSRGLQKELREAKARHKEALDLCERYMGHLHRAEADRDAAFQRGVAAMREAAAQHFSVVAPYDYIAPRIRSLPDPEDKP